MSAKKPEDYHWGWESATCELDMYRLAHREQALDILAWFAE